jgi:DNA-binding IclR family transcriptional regulator
MYERYVIPSVDRAFEVLSVMASTNRSLSLAELGRITSIPKSTLFRILTTLRKKNCVVAEQDGRKFRIGARMWDLGSSYVEQFEVYHAALPHMQSVAEVSGDTVFLGTVEEGEVFYTRRVESPVSITAVKKLGHRAPVHKTATGLAILAFMSDDEAQPIMRSLDAEAVERVRKRLATIVEKGYAVVDGEHNAELLCVSAPVFDHTGAPQASITIAMLSNQVAATGETVASRGELVKRAARNLSTEMGFNERRRMVGVI